MLSSGLKKAEAWSPRMISALAVAAAVVGAVGATAILMAPMESIHATPKPSIEFTVTPYPVQQRAGEIGAYFPDGRPGVQAS